MIALSDSTHRRNLLTLAFFMALVVLPAFTVGQTWAAIGFVQQNYAVPQSPQAAVEVTFPNAQAAGNLNIVVVGWNDTTASVSSVTDTNGNMYTLAVGPTTVAGQLSQSIYYAQNIASAAANSNTITVQFTAQANYADIRVLEYSGLDEVSPVDVTKAATGTNSTSSSGAVTTTNANDLIFGANTVTTSTSGPGTGFTSRVITSLDGDIAEDRVVSSAGSYTVSAPLSNAGAWVMQMVAFKASSGVADMTPPTAPSNLAATAASANQINLSWTASTDNVGVTRYLLERCQGAACTGFVQIATPTGTTYSDTGVAANTSYSYRVRATDAAGNLGPYSNVASATTPAATTVPGLVAAYSFNEGAGSSVGDASGNGNVGAITGATWTTAGKFGGALVFSGTSALVTVADAASLRLTTGMTLEAWVNPAMVTSVWRDVIYKGNDNYYLEGTSTTSGVPAGGGTFGGTGATLFGTAALAANTWTHLAVTYDGATLRLYVNGAQVSSGARTGNLATSANPLQIGGDSLYGQYFKGIIDEVRVYNVALTPTQIQADMNTSVGTTAPDTQAPTAPSNLMATAISGSQINLTWTASTDNVGVTGYLLERCQGAGCTSFAQIATPTGTAFSDTGVAANTNYSYRVRATDAAANLSAYSNVASAATPAPDTQPPTPPGALTATVGGAGQIDLSWTASTDNVGVTGYRIVRCEGPGCTGFAKIVQLSGTGTTYSDTGLAPNTSYSYEVRAMDAAGNLSDYSNVASATTPATIPGLVAAYSFDEGAGSTVGDASGNGNVGAITGATWTTAGKFGSALVFNGTSALVTITDAASLRLTTGMTLEAWVNPATVTNIWRDVIYKGNDNYYLEGTSTTSGVPAGGGTFGGTGATLFGTAALAANTWTHLAVTYDGATLRLYVNGAQVSSGARTGNLATSANPLQIGGDSLYGQYFKGIIDEVRVYNLALTPTQIQADMSGTVGGPSAPGSLTAKAISLSQIDLAWGAAVSSQGIAQYGVERCQGVGCTSFTQIATSSGTDYSDASLLANTSYSYRVRAFDTAGNPGAYSNVAEAYTGASVNPRVAALTFTRTQQFTATVFGGGSVIWSVDGVTGGSAASGTITNTGLYSPPSSVGTHTVTATTPDQSQSGSATVHVTNYAGTFTRHNDNFRTGQNLNETVLTPSNVTATTFGKLFSYPLDGVADASPLYVANVAIPGQGFHNMVYVATEHDTVYAFDADGLGGSPLWQVSFINPAVGVTTVPPDDTGECCDIAPEIGITGTPVIDQASSTLYLVAKTKEVNGTTTKYVHRLHALDITTGAEKFGGPVVIQATVAGSGIGSINGKISFNSLRENQRPALLLNNGIVYMAFASHGDNQPYHGWVLGYNGATLQQVLAYNVTPDGEGAGIWHSGGGLAADSSGNIYLVTGDGAFDADTGGVDFGDSFVKMNPSGAVVDYFTPANQASLNAANDDLGSGGVMLLPDQSGSHPHLLVGAGKNGSIDLVDRDNMGHYNPSCDPNCDSQIVQNFQNIFPFGTPEPGNYSNPVYFNGYVYFAPIADAIQAFRLSNGLFLDPTQVLHRSAANYQYPGGALAISANGGASGILWAVQKNPSGFPGVLRAYIASDPADLTTSQLVELYNSDQSGSRDTLDTAGAAKFSTPLVANGKVFVSSKSQLTVYGLLR